MNIDLFLQSPPIHVSSQHQEKSNHTEKQNEIANIPSKMQQLHPHKVQSLDEDSQDHQLQQKSSIVSSKKMSSMLAGKRARQKKKIYEESLESRVKVLQQEISRYEQEIRKTKQTLSRIVYSAKYNQNSLTYCEIEQCIQAEDPNENRINMLIDMIKFRVGGLGIERQAKIDYFIKQLLNSLFLSMQRYLMYCGDKELDLFQQLNIDQLLDMEQSQSQSQYYLSWTKQFLQQLNLDESQRNRLLQMKDVFKTKKVEVHSLVKTMKQVQGNILEQEKNYEQMIDEIRSVMNPVQGGVWLLFTDRIRYRGEIILDSQKQLYGTTKYVGMMPSKKVKKQ